MPVGYHYNDPLASSERTHSGADRLSASDRLMDIASEISACVAAFSRIALSVFQARPSAHRARITVALHAGPIVKRSTKSDTAPASDPGVKAEEPLG